MYLSNVSRIKIQSILKKISLDKEISLQERIFVEKQANHNSTVWNWLQKAQSIRRHGKHSQESIDGLMQSLGLNGLDKESHFDPENDDIADWFSGSPDWVRRS